MGRSNIIITILMLISLVGCGTNEATKVGNPSTNLPQTPKAFTEQYLKDHPIWKGSSEEGEGIAADIYLVEFDVNGIVKISSIDNPDPIELKYEVMEDGSIVTIDSPDSPFKIVATLKENSDIYPLDIKILDASDAVITQLFATNISTPAYYSNSSDPELMCYKSTQRCYDSDGDLVADGDYFVAGFVQTHDKYEDNCGLAVYDHCKIEGELLAEVVCTTEEKNGFNYAVNYVECSCQDGKCVDEADDEPMGYEYINVDICDINPSVCKVAVISKGEVSEDTDGTEPWWGDGAPVVLANSFSTAPSISANGRYVAFYSGASNLVPNDNNNRKDVFVRDLKDGTTVRISVSTSGEEGNSDSIRPSISGDGRYVVFESKADNLVPSDTNEIGDIFIHDMHSGITKRISEPIEGIEGANYYDSFRARISSNGRFVTFSSYTNNLVLNDATQDVADIFLHDLQMGITTLISVTSEGIQKGYNSIESSISGDGRYIAFSSQAALVPGVPDGYLNYYVHDAQQKKTILVDAPLYGEIEYETGYFSGSEISSNGRYVVFSSRATNLCPNDKNGKKMDTFVRDLDDGTITLVSVSTDGEQGNGGSLYGSISGDGRYVVFGSDASNLVDDDTNGYMDIFMRDLEKGTTVRVNVSDDGEETSYYNSGSPAISVDGRYVVFASSANNLVPGDTNGEEDVFVKDLWTGKITIASVPNG